VYLTLRGPSRAIPGADEIAESKRCFNQPDVAQLLVAGP